MEGQFSDGTIARVDGGRGPCPDSEDVEDLLHNDCGAGGNVGNLGSDDVRENEMGSSVINVQKKSKASGSTGPKRSKNAKAGASQQDDETSSGATDVTNTKNKSGASKSKGIAKRGGTRPPARPHKRLSQEVLVSRIADMAGKKQVLESKLVLMNARLELHRNEMQYRELGVTGATGANGANGANETDCGNM